MALNSSSPTMKDVARLAGVSPAAVSYVLNGRAKEKRISLGTCRSIQTVCRRLGYRRHYLATAMATRRSRTVGVVVANLRAEFIVRILDGLQEVLNDHDHQIALCMCNDNPRAEASHLDMLQHRCVDAVIALPVWTSRQPRHWVDFMKSDRPVVFIDRLPNQVAGACVGIHDYEVGLQAADRLVAKGASRLVLLRDSKNQTRTVLERERGFRTGVQRLGHDALFTADSTDFAEVQNALEVGKRQIGIFAPVTGWALRYFLHQYQSGNQARNDLVAASCGLDPHTSFLPFPWWMVAQPDIEMGRVAARWVLQGLGENATLPSSLTLPYRWEANHST